MTNGVDKVYTRLQTGRFVAFLATGGTSAVVNLVMRYGLSRLMFFEAAVTISYILSTALAFVLARRLVFRSSGGRWQAELGRFTIVSLVGFFQVLAISAFLLRSLFPVAGLVWHPEEIAHFIGLASLAVTSYQAHGRFSFRKGESVVSAEARR